MRLKLPILFYAILILSACGNSRNDIEISEPELDEREISRLESRIENGEQKLPELEEEIEEHEENGIDVLADTVREIKSNLERDINVYKANLEIAENTYYYNDEFSTTYDYSVLSKTNDSVLTLENHAQNFSNSILEDIQFYLEEGLIENGLIASSLVQLSESDEYARAIAVFLTRDTLESLDFEDLLDSDRRDLYSVADATWGRFDFVDEGIIHNSRWASNEEVPEIFSWYIGGLEE